MKQCNIIRESIVTTKKKEKKEIKTDYEAYKIFEFEKD